MSGKREKKSREKENAAYNAKNDIVLIINNAIIMNNFYYGTNTDMAKKETAASHK